MAAGRLHGTSSHSDCETTADCDTPHAPPDRSEQPRPRVTSTGAVLPALAARSNNHPGPIHWQQLSTAHLRSSPAVRSDPGAGVPVGPCDVASDATVHVLPDCTSPLLCDDHPSLNIPVTTAEPILVLFEHCFSFIRSIRSHDRQSEINTYLLTPTALFSMVMLTLL